MGGLGLGCRQLAAQSQLAYCTVVDIKPPYDLCGPACFCRVLFQDAAGGLFLYDAQHGELMVPPDWAGGQLQAAAWDGADQRLVAAVGSTGAACLR